MDLRLRINIYLQLVKIGSHIPGHRYRTAGCCNGGRFSPAALTELRTAHAAGLLPVATKKQKRAVEKATGRFGLTWQFLPYSHRQSVAAVGSARTGHEPNRPDRTGQPPVGSGSRMARSVGSVAVSGHPASRSESLWHLGIY